MPNWTSFMSVIKIEADVILRLKSGEEFEVGKIEWDAPVTLVPGDASVVTYDPQVRIYPQNPDNGVSINE